MMVRCMRCGNVEKYRIKNQAYIFCHNCGYVNRVEKKDGKNGANKGDKIKKKESEVKT